MQFRLIRKADELKEEKTVRDEGDFEIPDDLIEVDDDAEPALLPRSMRIVMDKNARISLNKLNSMNVHPETEK